MFLRLEQLTQNQRTFGSFDGVFIKSNRTKNTSKMLRFLLGLIYYSNTIFGNISGKNKVISHHLRLIKAWASICLNLLSSKVRGWSISKSFR